MNKCYLRPTDMLGHMYDFAVDNCSPGIKCVPLEDVGRNRIGFEVTIYDSDIAQSVTRDFWTKLQENSPWNAVLRTPQGRDWVAVSNSNGYPLWGLSDPSTEPSCGQKYPWYKELEKC